jgi:hypothetical protein
MKIMIKGIVKKIIAILVISSIFIYKVSFASNYAVLFSGGKDKNNNKIIYFNNVKGVYDLLTEHWGYIIKKTSIY